MTTTMAKTRTTTVMTEKTAITTTTTLLFEDQRDEGRGLRHRCVAVRATAAHMVGLAGDLKSIYTHDT